MLEQTLRLVEDEFGLEGISADAYEVVCQMADPWKGTKRQASDLEILVRALALQTAGETANEVKVIRPEKFSRKLNQVTKDGVSECLLAESLRNVLSEE